MTPTRPVLRYHGGKWKIAKWVLSYFPPHDIYIEPYGGAASVLIQKPPVQTEVWNDLDHELVNMFQVLRDPLLADTLIEKISLTPFARKEFDASYDETDDPVERARHLIVRSFFGYGSKSCISRTRNGFRSMRYGDNSPAVDWSTYPNALLAIVNRMQRVVVECQPAIEVIKRYDRPEALIYADPPYVHSTRTLKQASYRHEMPNEQHEELAQCLHAAKGSVILSGYDSPLYRRLYKDWRCETKDTYADKSSKRVEFLWISPKADIHHLPGFPKRKR